MRRFNLCRLDADDSGPFTVAEGVVNDDGWVALFWGTVPRSVSLYYSMVDMLAIHGPRASAFIQWLDD